MDDWLTMTAAELGREIDAGKIDPRALAERFLTASAEHEYAPRIYARLTRERALAEADAAHSRARAGLRRSPLDGVPISWKDLFDSAGTATESGSAFLKGRVPDTDAEVLANATAQGLVCLGKTHMTELAFSGLGLNPITESPPCVNDPDAVSGGSSSGAAISVAFGLAAAGIGSDTGGSVRIPAAWNDLVGLKTTSGRLSLTGVVPLCPKFDTVGPLCRSVEDAAMLLAAMEAGKPADLAGGTLAGKHLVVLETVALDGLREMPRKGFDMAVEHLRSAGARIETRTIPAVVEALDLAPMIVPSEAYGVWREEIEARPELMYPEVRERFCSGRDVFAPDYVAAWRALDRCRARYLADTADADAVILPSVALGPPKRAALEADGALFSSENLLALRNTRIANLLGLCSLTLPTGVPSAGLMLFAPPMQEERLLRLGQSIERLFR